MIAYIYIKCICLKFGCFLTHLSIFNFIITSIVFEIWYTAECTDKRLC